MFWVGFVFALWRSHDYLLAWVEGPGAPSRNRFYEGQDLLELLQGTKCFVWEQSQSPFLLYKAAFPSLEQTQSLWDQRPPRIICGQTRQDHFPCNQHPGTAPGCLNCQGWGRTKTRAKNGQVSHLCPLLIKISTSSSPSDSESCLETYEIQESTERKRYTWKGPYKQDRQIDEPKENHQRLGGERKAECWSQTGRDRRLKV